MTRWASDPPRQIRNARCRSRPLLLVLSRAASQTPSVERLPHGYTNRTRRVGDVFEKCYAGPDAWARARRELSCLSALHDRLPVPRIVLFDESIPKLVLTEVAGRHGQELIEEGHAPTVLRLIGEQLACLQGIDHSTVPGLEGEWDVVVHRDFGPQNILVAANVKSAVGLLDWESAHFGSPLEDLSWAEWIVRMHHPQAITFLPELFEGPRLSAGWPERHAAMLAQCHRYLRNCETAEVDDGVSEWKRRLRATEQWRERP